MELFFCKIHGELAEEKVFYTKKNDSCIKKQCSICKNEYSRKYYHENEKRRQALIIKKREYRKRKKAEKEALMKAECSPDPLAKAKHRYQDVPSEIIIIDGKRMIKHSDICRMYGYYELNTLHEWMKNKNFPQIKHIGKRRAYLWEYEEVNKWMFSQPRKSIQQIKNRIHPARKVFLCNIHGPLNKSNVIFKTDKKGNFKGFKCYECSTYYRDINKYTSDQVLYEFRQIDDKYTHIESIPRDIFDLMKAYLILTNAIWWEQRKTKSYSKRNNRRNENGSDTEKQIGE